MPARRYLLVMAGLVQGLSRPSRLVWQPRASLNGIAGTSPAMTGQLPKVTRTAPVFTGAVLAAARSNQQEVAWQRLSRCHIADREHVDPGQGDGHIGAGLGHVLLQAGEAKRAQVDDIAAARGMRGQADDLVEPVA